MVRLSAVSLLRLRRQKPRNKQKEDGVKQKGTRQENWFPVTGADWFSKKNVTSSSRNLLALNQKKKKRKKQSKKKPWYVWTRSKVTAVLEGSWA